MDYKPQVVVVRAGDLTEEEAEREKQRLLRGASLFITVLPFFFIRGFTRTNVVLCCANFYSIDLQRNKRSQPT